MFYTEASTLQESSSQVSCHYRYFFYFVLTASGEFLQGWPGWVAWARGGKMVVLISKEKVILVLKLAKIKMPHKISLQFLVEFLEYYTTVFDCFIREI